MGERGLWIFKKSAAVRTPQAVQKTDYSRFAVAVNKTAIRILFPRNFSKNVSVGIYSLNGRTLLQRSVAAMQHGQAVINTVCLANNPIKPGVYLLRVKNGEGIIFEKTFIHLQ